MPTDPPHPAPPPGGPPATGRAHAARIAQIAAAIPGLDADAMAVAEAHQRRLTKPPGALGRLETLATQLAGMQGTTRPRVERPLIVVAAGDHGVAQHGVSAYPAEVTGQMVANFLAGGAAINVLARQAGARVRIVDAGVATPTPDVPELLRLRLGPGTDDITRGPAMTREQAERCIAEGSALIAAADEAHGVDLIGCGEMGIGNTTAAAALIATFTARAPREVTGRGTGVDDERYARKLQAVEQAIAINRPDATDPVGTLQRLGGFEIGVLAGVMLGAAARRIPVLVDGVISGAAALVAAGIAPAARGFMLAAHRSAEPGHHHALAHLELTPLLDLGMRLGEGSGAALAMPLCASACRLLDEMATFEDAGVSDSSDVVEHEG